MAKESLDYNVLKAILLYLDELGFDFRKNSAIDLIKSVGEISRIATEDQEVNKRISYYINEMEEHHA